MAMTMKKLPADLKTLNPREAALVVLHHFEAPHTDAGALLHERLESGGITGADARLATELALGTIRRRSSLDNLLKPLLKAPWNKTQRILRDILRLGAYQLTAMDRIPARAAVNESVELARRWATARGAAMVNAVLRRLADQPVSEAPADPPRAHWARHFSHPEWLIKYLLDEHTPDEVRALLDWNNRAPSVFLRANLRATTTEQLAARLSAEGAKIGRVGSPTPEAVEVLGGMGEMVAAGWMRQGEATVQDAAAQLVARFLAPRPGERIVDWCAAPGGKSTHLAELSDDRAKILALDVDADRLTQVAGHAERLGLKSVRTYNLRPELIDWLAQEPADAILVDAPCAGLGTIQRHPDIRWRRKPQDPERSARLQGEILHAAARCVAPGKRLIYSTCTVGRTENEQVIERFLKRHRGFRRAGRDLSIDPSVLPYLDDQGDLHTWPPEHGMDGFYAARLVRMR